jgi:hypothetical protein
VPELSNDQMTLALAVVAGVTLLCLIISIFLSLRLKKVRSQYALIRADGEPRDIFSVVNRSMQRVDTIEHRVDGVAAALEENVAIARFAIQRFALIRYDAFEEMGGQLSFSAALLDDHGDGLVITSINGRTETRTYAKPVKNLSSTHNLSDEERKAIATASSGSGRIEAGASAAR